MANQRSVIEQAIRGMLGLSETSGEAYTQATARARAKIEETQEESMPGFGDSGFSEGATAVGQRISQGGGKDDDGDDKDDKRKWWQKKGESSEKRNLAFDKKEKEFSNLPGQSSIEQSG